MKLTAFLLSAASLLMAAEIKLDGILDEPAWEKATKYEGFHNLLGRTQLKNQPTWFKIVPAKEGVYIGVHCTEPNIASIPVGQPGEVQHSSIFNRDHVEFFLSPAKDRDCFYQFALDMNNTQWCQYYVEAGASAFEKYHSLWQSAIGRTDDAWCAEVFIPYNAFYHTSSSELKGEWYINIARQRKSVKPAEITCWAPLRDSFHEPRNFNEVKGFPLKTADQDFSIRNVSYTVKGADDNNLEGTLTIDLSTGIPRKGGTLQVGEPFNCQLQFKDLKKGNNLITFDKIKAPLSTNGVKFNTLVQFEDYGGRYYKMPITFKACSIALDEPCYRDSFYPDQTPEVIAGVLSANVADGTKAVLNIEGAGLKEKVTAKVKDGKCAFSFNAKKMEIGSAIIKATAGNYTAELKVNRLPMPKNGIWTRISKEGVYIRNGKPAFYLGWRGGTEYLVGSQAKKEWPTVKDRCPVVNDLGAEFWIDNMVKPEMPRSTRDVEPSPEYMEKVKQKILENKDKHIMGWMLGEEPECRAISAVYLKHVYELIKELDPYNPVICCTRAPREYIDTADLFRVHPYLSPMEDAEGNRSMKTPTFVGKVCNETSDAGHERKALWVTLGFFAYNFINMWATPPNYDECNCMTWAAVVNGAKGFYTYIFYQTFESYELMLASDYIYFSLDRLKDYIMSQEKDTECVVKSESPVEARIKTLGKDYVLIVVNESPAPATAEVTSSVLKKQLLEFRGDRTFIPSNKKLSFNLAPYEAIVLTSKKEDAGLETLASLRSRVKQHDDAAASAGNILYKRGREIEFSILDPNTRSHVTCMQALLTNGTDYDMAWRAKSPNAAVEMMFPTFKPEFNRLVVHGAKLKGLEVYKWKLGKYVKLEPDQVNESEFKTEFIFNEKVGTIKIKLQFKQYQAELTEIEMF